MKKKEEAFDYNNVVEVFFLNIWYSLNLCKFVSYFFMIYYLTHYLSSCKHITNLQTKFLVFPFLSSKRALIEIGSEEIHGFVSWKQLQWAREEGKKEGRRIFEDLSAKIWTDMELVWTREKHRKREEEEEEEEEEQSIAKHPWKSLQREGRMQHTHKSKHKCCCHIVSLHLL